MIRFEKELSKRFEIKFDQPEQKQEFNKSINHDEEITDESLLYEKSKNKI